MLSGGDKQTWEDPTEDEVLALEKRNKSVICTFLPLMENIKTDRVRILSSVTR